MDYKIGFFKKIHLWFIARKDVKSSFGNDVHAYYTAMKDKTPPKDMLYPVSNFMQYHVRLYKLECEREINAYSQQRIIRFSADIPKSCRRIKELGFAVASKDPDVLNEIKSIDSEIKGLQQKLDEKTRQKVAVNAGEAIDVNSGAMNLADLTFKVSELEQSIETLRTRKNSITNNSTNVMSSNQKQLEDAKRTLEVQIAEFSKAVDEFAENIEVINSRYDTELHYYWVVVCRMKKCSVIIKPFKEVCKICELAIFDKSNLFIDMRDNLRSLCSDVGFSLGV